MYTLLAQPLRRIYAHGVRILFVCMGNICRSPVMEAVVRAHAARAGLAIEVASAGTEAYHVGDSADRRAIASAQARGYDLVAHRARHVEPADFDVFDHVLAMDRANLRTLAAQAPGARADRLALFLEFAGTAPPHEVP